MDKRPADLNLLLKEPDKRLAPPPDRILLYAPLTHCVNGVMSE